MAEVDPAKPLKEFKPKKKFFVGIDSDGCAFDTMGIKQRECFCPWMIAYFSLQPVAQAARECKEFADLFSRTRGANRHKTTKRIIAELLPSHPMVKTRKFKVPQYPHYFAWVDDPNSLLSNDGLKQAIAKANLSYAAKGKYEKDHILMIGDAPGDMKAAKANDALFYPVNPGEETESWKRFHDEAFDKFIDGQYAGSYEEKLIAGFLGHLPETPPWEQ